ASISIDVVQTECTSAVGRERHAAARCNSTATGRFPNGSLASCNLIVCHTSRRTKHRQKGGPRTRCHILGVIVNNHRTREPWVLRIVAKVPKVTARVWNGSI